MRVDQEPVAQAALPDDWAVEFDAAAASCSEVRVREHLVFALDHALGVDADVLPGSAQAVPELDDTVVAAVRAGDVRKDVGGLPLDVRVGGAKRPAQIAA
jgi:hypothetical protein